MRNETRKINALEDHAVLVVWKPPALKILILSILGNLAWAVTIAALFFSKGKSGTETQFELLICLFIAITGVSILWADLRFRRREELSLMSRNASTVFFFFPTWVVGVLVFLFSLLVAAALFLP